MRPTVHVLAAVAVVATAACASPSSDGATTITAESAAPGAERDTTPIADSSLDTLSAQQPSSHPIGGEWNDLVVPLRAADVISERAYNDWQRRISECMAERGFEYEPIKYLEVSVPDLRRALNPLNETTARNYGYHVPELPEVERTSNPSEAFAQALDGTDTDPESGCASPANSQAYAGLGDYFDDVQALVNSLADAVAGYETTPDAVAALAEWSSCMNELGYNYDTPDQARAQFETGSSITPEERTVRLADLECDRATELTAEQSSWERQRFDQWKDETASVWTELEIAAQQASETLTAREEAAGSTP